MKTAASLLACSILAIWVVAIGIFSVQNATLVSLSFLGWESIKLPVGVVLAFSAAIGVMGGAIVLPLLGQLNRQSDDNRFDDDFQADDRQNNPTDTNDWLETGSQDW